MRKYACCEVHCSPIMEGTPLLFTGIPFQPEEEGYYAFTEGWLVRPGRGVHVKEYLLRLNTLLSHLEGDHLDFSLYSFSDVKAKFCTGLSYEGLLSAITLDVEVLPVSLISAITPLGGSEALLLLYAHREYEKVVSSHIYTIFRYIPPSKELKRYSSILGLPLEKGLKILKVTSGSLRFKGTFKGEIAAAEDSSLIVGVKEWRVRGFWARDPLEARLAKLLFNLNLLRLEVTGEIRGERIVGKDALIEVDYMPLNLRRPYLVVRLKAEGLAAV